MADESTQREPTTTAAVKPDPADADPPAAGAAAPGASAQLLALGERIAAGMRAAARAVAARRGMTLTLVGVVVLILAWLSERDSAWGFPMLITGMVLIGLGLIGPRLSGSLALRWGDDGAFFQMTGTMAPVGERRTAPALPAGATASAGDEATQPGIEQPEALIPPTEIDGQAETIEFTVEALRDAARAAASQGDQTGAA